MRHMWRQPLPPIDQKSVQLIATPNRAERPVGDQPTKRPSVVRPTN